LNASTPNAVTGKYLVFPLPGTSAATRDAGKFDG
jgi:hypothetical protein